MFSKSKIMRRAHNIRKETGCTMSEALRKTWVEVKRLAEINNQLFDLNMIDFQSYGEKLLAARLSMERADLNSKINSKSAQEIVAEAEKNRQTRARWEEAEDIRFELGRIMRSGNPNWVRYDSLKNRLREIA